MKNQYGFISFRMITFLCAMIGVWFLWHAYQDGTLVSSLKTVFGDYAKLFSGESSTGGSTYGRMNRGDNVFSEALDQLKSLIGGR